MKFPRALSRVNCLKTTNISGKICPYYEGLNPMSHQTLVIGTVTVPEISVISNTDSPRRFYSLLDPYVFWSVESLSKNIC